MICSKIITALYNRRAIAQLDIGNKMLTIKQALNIATQTLENANIKSAGLDSRILLQFAINKTKEYLISNWDETLTSTENATFLSIVERRANLEPIAYIIGSKEFYSYNFHVNNKVLIPRPDTEILVDAIISHAAERNDTGNMPSIKMLELGVGSGCVSISLLHEIKYANIVATDISEEAILVARHNAQIHNVSSRLDIIHSDWFKNIGIQKFDIILSNPPYISKSESYLIAPETIAYEPHNALYTANEEYNAYQYIAKDAKEFLNDQGKLFFEVGFNQADSVIEIFSAQNFIVDKIYNDLSGIKRTICFSPKL
jgi:release factor glutamine methyltransferase